MYAMSNVFALPKNSRTDCSHVVLLQHYVQLQRTDIALSIAHSELSDRKRQLSSASAQAY